MGYNFVETSRKFTVAKLSISSRLLLALMKIRAYGSKVLRLQIFVVFPQNYVLI